MCRDRRSEADQAGVLGYDTGRTAFGGAMRSSIAWLNEFDTMKHCSNKNNVLGLDWMTMLPWRVEKKALCQRIVRDRIYKAVSLALPTVSDFSEEALQ